MHTASIDSSRVLAFTDASCTFDKLLPRLFGNSVRYGTVVAEINP
jgi:hypothetical protein